ncbi:hypothetical protein GCM10009582_32190 [Arthrobacter flavus]
MPQRGLVGAQRRMAQVPDRAQVPEILLDVGRRPMPGVFVHVLHEPADIPGALVDRVELQVPRELLDVAGAKARSTAGEGLDDSSDEIRRVLVDIM